MSLFTDVRDAGIPHDSHESDLYVLDTPGARAILARHPRESSGSSYFTSPIDGRRWIDVPFAYEPWWEARRLVDRDRPRRRPIGNRAGGVDAGGSYAASVERALARFGLTNSRALIEQHHEQIAASRRRGEPASRVARRIAGMPAYPTKQRKEGRAAYAVKVERALARFGFTNSRAMIEEHHGEIGEAYGRDEPAVHVARRIAGMPAYPSSSKRGSNMAHESNRAKSFARSKLGKRALPKTTETRVASLDDLGVAYDPEAFYSVKGGKLMARRRRSGKGFGAAKTLGSWSVLGTRGRFYFVRDGVVYARSRRKEQTRFANMAGTVLLAPVDVARLPVGSIVGVWVRDSYSPGGRVDRGWVVVDGGALLPMDVLPRRGSVAIGRDGMSPEAVGSEFALIAEGRGRVPTHDTAVRKAEEWARSRRGGGAK